MKGARPQSLAQIAQSAVFTAVTVTGPDGRERAAQINEFVCLWYKPFHAQPVKVILIRNPGSTEGFDIALASTDADTAAGELIIRYDSRWTIETCHQEAKAHGAGDARNRVEKAVHRTVPFGFLAQTITITWYAIHGGPKPTSTPAAEPPRSTARRSRSAIPTCSPRSAADLSATSFGHKHPK